MNARCFEEGYQGLFAFGKNLLCCVILAQRLIFSFLIQLKVSAVSGQKFSSVFSICQ